MQAIQVGMEKIQTMVCVDTICSATQSTHTHTLMASIAMVTVGAPITPKSITDDISSQVGTTN